MGCLTIDGAEIEPTGRAPLPCEGDAPRWPLVVPGNRFQEPTVLDQRLTNDTRQPNENKRRQTRSNATLIIRFCRLFRGGRTAHTGLVAPVPWFVADFENGSGRTEHAGTIQLANKYTFVSQLFEGV